MFEPARALYAFRPSAPAGLIAAAVAVATLFASTPFILSELATRFDVSLGVAGILSTVQVGTFAVASFAAGRVLRSSRMLPVIAAGLGIAGNAASVFAPSFPILLVTRVVAGVAAGVLTWIAWADAVHDRGRLADIAAAGPLTVIVAAPFLGWMVELGGDRAVFAAVAVAHVPVLFLRIRPDDTRASRRVGPAHPAATNRVLLAALGVATAGGSSVFIFSAAFATSEVGLSPVAASVAFSLNAAAGLAGTRARTPRSSGGWWMLGPAASVAALVLLPTPVAFYGVMVLWGLTWWLAVPDVLRSIATHTDAPDGRMGDAQAIMAAGRATGPLIGGALIATSGFPALGFVAFSALTTAAVGILAVEGMRRAERGIQPTS